MYGRFSTILFVALAGCSIGACTQQTAPDASDMTEVEDTAVRKEFGKGPVKLSVELSADSITTADALTCTMTLSVPKGYEAELPDLVFPMDLPGMILTHFDEHESKEAERTLTIREYELEPEYPGTFELPSLDVYYHRENKIQEEMFETDPIPFEVTETPASAEMLALKPVRGLVTVEQIRAERRRMWPWIVGGVAGALALASLVVYLVRRPRPAPPPRPAHEVALERLRSLAAQDLVGKGQIEPFFVEITWIVRDYIERAFGLRAPEQTTEEFLANITSVASVARHREVLGPFLTAADEVKFARATPDANTIQRTFDTARDFILQTSSSEGGEV